MEAPAQQSLSTKFRTRQTCFKQKTYAQRRVMQRKASLWKNTSQFCPSTEQFSNCIRCFAASKWVQETRNSKAPNGFQSTTPGDRRVFLAATRAVLVRANSRNGLSSWIDKSNVNCSDRRITTKSRPASLIVAQSRQPTTFCNLTQTTSANSRL